MATLSCNYRLIAFSEGGSKSAIKRLCKILAEKDFNRPQIVFDAVYLFKK